MLNGPTQCAIILAQSEHGLACWLIGHVDLKPIRGGGGGGGGCFGLSTFLSCEPEYNLFSAVRLGTTPDLVSL
jgi:hypothetical protein